MAGKKKASKKTKASGPVEVPEDDAPIEMKKRGRKKAGTKRFKVLVKYQHPMIVEATSKDEAWEVYKEQRGMLSCSHIPKISEVN